MASIPVPIPRRSKVLPSDEVENRDRYPATSRYKNAKYFKRVLPSIGKRIEPETWVPPGISPSPSDLSTEIRSGEEGRLDLVSQRVYNIDSLWWVIAYVNDIIDPFEEATVGRRLRYPPFDVVASLVLA